MSERDVAGKGPAPLLRQRGERPREAVARLARLDHLVDEALLRSELRAQMLLGIGAGERLAVRLGVLGTGDIAPRDDADGLLGAHHADLRFRPGEREVRSEVA